MITFDPVTILLTLARADVEFIVVGQAAAVMHGHPETTIDLDVVVKRDIDNAERLADALRELDAHHADSDMGPDERDFIGWRHVRQYDTSAGPVDIIPSASGVGGFEDLIARARPTSVDGTQILVASLDDIIASKEAADRPKDRRRLPSLRDFRDRRHEQRPRDDPRGRA